ncbi:2-isopropylmalate synthase [Myxococcota bacterium]|nr:2-isopropylmalate synthase [Myxococcota bacterium]
MPEGSIQESEVIFDWNAVRRGAVDLSGVELYDESLRDGIQSPTAVDPTVAEKVRILELQDACGIQHTDIGLPGAGPRAVEDVTALAMHIRDARLSIRATCAARTHPADIRPVIEIGQKVGIPIEAMTFLGSSPIRMFAEGWDLDRLKRLTADAVDLCVQNGVEVTFVTEDTTRSRPDTLETLFKVAIDHGAAGLCVCDTVGHATPEGVAELVAFTRGVIDSTGAKVRIDWHGHNDRGLGLINAIAAAVAGADRVHGTVLGIGERVGNTPIDLLLVNLALMGFPRGDLGRLREYCELGARATRTPLPFNYPVFGRDAFRTGTGVHAAAVIKAMRKGDHWLADRIYSGVPAGLFGARQRIEVGHMSGESNVIAWLEVHGFQPTDDLVGRVFEYAKRSNRVLEDDEILALVRGDGGGGG